MLRKCICMIVTVALVVCVSVSPVGAVDASGSFSISFMQSSGDFVVSNVSVPRVGNKGVVNTFSGLSSVSYISLWTASYISDDSQYPSGDIGVYLSWCPVSTVPGSFTNAGGVNSASYSISNTSSFVAPVSVSEFNFSDGVSGHYPSVGYQLTVRLTDIDALTAFSFTRPDVASVAFTPDDSSAAYDMLFYVPSATLVYTASSADLDALESVADQIAEGNAIAQAMYGDIMAALNAISGDTELMASYINDCITYLNAIDNKTMNIYNLCASYLHNLADIAQTAEDIEAELESFHTDFMSKLDLLISTITSESDDIQATMNSIYQQLIAWLESNFTEAINPELDSTNDDLNQGIANSEAIEQEWTGSLSDNWSAMHIDDFSFDSSFTSGFMWVSAWVTNIYNALGLYGSIIILPLIIGICKLLLGYFRFSGHGHSSGGDDVDA